MTLKTRKGPVSQERTRQGWEVKVAVIIDHNSNLILIDADTPMIVTLYSVVNVLAALNRLGVIAVLNERG